MATNRFEQFARSLLPDALAVSAASGIPVAALLAIPINETGADPVGNILYGIKGPGLTARTFEVVDGRRVDTDASFRTYETPRQAMEDFVRFLHENPRYANVVQNLDRLQDPEAFATALQRAGYATDPNWGKKIGRIAETVVAPVLATAGLIGEGVPVAMAADDVMQGPPDLPPGPDVDLGGGAGAGAGLPTVVGDPFTLGGSPNAQTVRVDTGNEIIVFERQENGQWVPVIREPKAQATEPDRVSSDGRVFERQPDGTYRLVFEDPVAAAQRDFQNRLDLIRQQMDQRQFDADEAARRFDEAFTQYQGQLQRAQEQRAQFQTGLNALDVGLSERGQRLGALDAAQGRFLQALPSQAIPGQTHFLGFEPTRGVAGQFSGPAATLFRGLGIGFNPDQFRAPITNFNPFAQVQQVLSDFRAPQFTPPSLPTPPTPEAMTTTPGTPALPALPTPSVGGASAPSAATAAMSTVRDLLPAILRPGGTPMIPNAQQIAGAILGPVLPDWLRIPFGVAPRPNVPAPTPTPAPALPAPTGTPGGGGRGGAF